MKIFIGFKRLARDSIMFNAIEIIALCPVYATPHV